MITFKQQGDFNNTEKFLKKVSTTGYTQIFEKYASKGVDILTLATPIDSGETASSWKYKIKHDNNGTTIIWTNSHLADGIPIAILIQYGHATRNGGYVQGRDFINPALIPLMDELAETIWREVKQI